MICCRKFRWFHQDLTLGRRSDVMSQDRQMQMLRVLPEQWIAQTANTWSTCYCVILILKIWDNLRVTFWLIQWYHAPYAYGHISCLLSILQKFLFLEAIFHLQQPMVCLSHISYGIPGLDSHAYFILRARCDFYASFSDSDMSGNVWNPTGNSLLDMEISSNIMKSPSPNVYDIIGHDHIQWHPPFIRYFTISWLCYWTGTYYYFWHYYLIPGGFHWTFATVVASKQRTLTPPDT